MQSFDIALNLARNKRCQQFGPRRVIENFQGGGSGPGSGQRRGGGFGPGGGLGNGNGDHTGNCVDNLLTENSNNLTDEDLDVKLC